MKIVVNSEISSYISPKLELRPSEKGNFGLFALESMSAGELLVVWGGIVVTSSSFYQLPDNIRRLSLQVEEGIFLVPVQLSAADYVNHSCDPNAGLVGQITLVALRPIMCGEEICYDYATSDGEHYDDFECKCGTELCRGLVTADDWKISDLWDRYAGYFSPYLQRRINFFRKQSIVDPPS